VCVCISMYACDMVVCNANETEKAGRLQAKNDDGVNYIYK